MSLRVEFYSYGFGGVDYFGVGDVDVDPTSPPRLPIERPWEPVQVMSVMGDVA